MVKRSTKSGVDKAKKPTKAKAVKTPPPPVKPPTTQAEINRIGDIIKNARGIWFGLLSASVFAAITLFSVKDASFFILSEETKLPLLGISVPITSFFWAGALLISALYTYLHLYLVQLWDALSDADAQFEGKPLADVIHPWLVSDAALRMRDRLRRGWQNISDIDLDSYRQHRILGNPIFRLYIKWMNRLGQWWNGPAKANDVDHSSRRRGMSYVGTFVSVSLVWFSGLIVIAFFWWRSMPSHDLALTSWLAYLLSWTLYVFWQSSSYALAKLGKKPHQSHRHRMMVFIICALVISIFTIFQTQNDYWEGEPRISRSELAEGCTDYQKNVKKRTWCPYLINVAQEFLRPARAELAETVFTQKPASWKGYDLAKQEFRKSWCKQIVEKVCEINPLDENPQFDEKVEEKFEEAWKIQLEAILATFSKPDLRGKRLEGADLRFAQLEGVRLKNTRLQGANLGEAKMQGADLLGARLQGADLSRAKMQGADLTEAKMQGADLREAEMQGANLREAEMQRAVLLNAKMQGAVLKGAEMQGANLTRAKMQGANLIKAEMQRAVLRGAEMQDADLTWAEMQGAYLSEANMQGAYLSETNMQGAYLSGANMKGADLSGAKMQGTPEEILKLQSTDLREVNFSASTLRFVDFTGAYMADLRNFEKSFGDSSVNLAGKITRPNGWCESLLSDEQYWGRYRGWLQEHELDEFYDEEITKHPLIPFGTPCPEE